ncbi:MULTISPECIES: HEAT repeat domain-containing protein [Calothrix]|uniref:HEAT repeat domain-containing protein n=2 Tax=Calothrix TaxID=1186 RepID=A0ABR8A6B1_9CYAN|nr:MULTISPECIES: HEAT repeat domain-containing protein [Calothrix]MBD2195530.1 HEAT repeat domain-containing protein [Calothrix parietina FACHB-288]MBD2224145.1 HEAT repeat domain-containing protein [Calothrix anomala FACHB-343]
MLIEWFTTWVAGKAFGFLVKTIISEDFAKDLVKDCAKDFFKFIFHSAVTVPFQQEPLQKAEVMALTEFLQLMQQDLEYHALDEDEIKNYIQPIKQFLKHPQVREILGNAFEYNCQAINTNKLAEIWYQLNASSPLPDDFNWNLLSKKYIKKVKEIILEVPELRAILDSHNLDTIRENTTQIAGIIPDFDLERYQEGIRESYGHLKLDSFDTSGYAYNELKLWRIFIEQNVREVEQVLPAVYELPKEHLRRLKETNQLETEVATEELEKHKRVYLEQPIRPVLDIVNEKQKYKYVVILGDPGSGKSTLLQYLALNWAESPLNNIISLPIPLLIELRTYMRRRDEKECHNFLEFFHKCSGAISHLNQHQLHAQLKAGKALVMFDGLDEVFEPGKREDVITDIHRFTNEYPQVQVIVTSRVIGYKPQRLKNAEFHHFMLQDLDSAQIQNFIQRWHDLTFSDAADKVRKRERLQRGIENSKAIKELAGNPLLLTMMAILNRNQELPRDRAELYNQASRVLLHQWDVERALLEDKRIDPKTIDYKDKQAMLRQVAYFMQTSDKGLAGNLISASNLEKILTDYLKTIEVSQAREAARVMINQLRTRNFMLCFLGADYYAFVHRTFLEYFCAWEFVWQFKETQTLTIEQLKNEVFGKHWQDETWHEVLLLIAGMIEPKFVGEIIEYLMLQDGDEEKFVNLFLAAKCLAEVRNSSLIASIANELLNKIKALISYDLWYYYVPYYDEEETQLVQKIRTQAVAAVATTWQESLDIKTWLKDRATQDDDNYVRLTAIAQLADHFRDDSDTKTWLKHHATQDDNWVVRLTAIEQLAEHFRDDPDTKTILKHRATQDDDNFVRRTAIAQLAQHFPDDPDTKTFLKDRATQDDDNYVRFVAIQQLAEKFKDDPDTKTILKHCATQDDDNYVRGEAIQQLAEHFKDDLDTKTFLKDRATQDDDNYVRRTAITQLAQHFKDDPNTKTILKDRATQDDNWDVQGRAIAQLAQHFKDDPDTKTILKHRATQDDHYNVRGTAIAQLAEKFKDDPDTKTILKDRATQDNNNYVRGTAIAQLAQHFKDDPDTKTILKDRTTQDDHYSVRGAAIAQLAENFQNDPDTKTFLKYRATQDNFFDVRGTAITQLAQHFKDDPNTTTILKDRATQDDDNYVRRTAIQQLAKHFKYQLELFEIYYHCAANDLFQDSHNPPSNPNPRYIALDIIIKQFPQHPQTLPLLQDKAKNDPDEKVREFAQKKLKQLEVI